MPKVSVIIPVYNSEKYIRQCVDSVLAQTLQDIEIILVDDGSLPLCAAMCDAYAQKDKRIRVIHKENTGYGSTMNQAIQLASGEYIGIVEADDFIEPDMYEKLYENAHTLQTDITKCYFYHFNQFCKKQNRRHRFTSDLSKEPTGVFCVADYPEILTYHSSVWAAVYKRTFIRNIKMPETPGASYQDFPFVFEALLRAKRLSIVPAFLVHYRKEKNQNSSTVQPGKQVLHLVDHAQYVQNLMMNMGVYERYKNEFWRHATSCLHGYFKITSDTYRDAYYHQLVSFYQQNAADLPTSLFNPMLAQFTRCLIDDRQEELYLTRQPRTKLYKTLIRLYSCFILNKQKRRDYRKRKFNHINKGK